MTATGPSPFKVRDNPRPERTMSGVRKPTPESSVPGDNLPGEVGGINCGGDMGVRRCLARFLTSLALLRTPKSANGPRSNSFRPDSPLRQPTIRGRKAQPAPHTTPNMARSVRVPHFQLKSTTSIHLIRNSFSSSLFFVSCAAATIGSHCSTYCLAVSLFLQKILRYKSAFF